jgi:hypothetical protein
VHKSEHENNIEYVIKQQNNAIVIKFIIHIKLLYYWKRSLVHFIQLRDYIDDPDGDETMADEQAPITKYTVALKSTVFIMVAIITATLATDMAGSLVCTRSVNGIDQTRVKNVSQSAPLFTFCVLDQSE